MNSANLFTSDGCLKWFDKYCMAISLEFFCGSQENEVFRALVKVMHGI